MKIVITGSSGFIGSHLKDSLKEHDIIEWDIKLGKDIRNFTLDKNVDFIIHLAGLMSESLYKYQMYIGKKM